MNHKETFPIRLVLTMDREMMDAITEWRRQQDDLPSRVEAIRRLIELALKTAKQQRTKAP